jgi:hypothetical protein
VFDAVPGMVESMTPELATTLYTLAASEGNRAKVISITQ